MYIIFQDKRTLECFSVSQNALDFPEFLEFEQRGLVKRVFVGKKRDCDKYLENEVEVEMI
jgi:hypothetical protein